jgi:hypothetical protein
MNHRYTFKRCEIGTVHDSDGDLPTTEQTAEGTAQETREE